MLEAITQIIDALSTATPTVITITILLIFVVGFVKGWWVPGWVYQREVKRGDAAEDAVEASTRAIQNAADANKLATNAAMAVAERLISLERSLGVKSGAQNG